MAIILTDRFALPHEKFSYHKGCLVSEASTLGYMQLEAVGELMFKQIYDDACDVGIAIRGKHHLIRFYLSSQDKDAEGDVAGWRFKPIPEDARRHPECANTSVLIIND
jgi:hypothetical protein